MVMIINGLKKILFYYMENQIFLYMGLYIIAKDEFKYPNLFFEKVTNGLMTPRKNWVG